MMMQSLPDIIVFDLEDTLYKEVLFVESGFKSVAHHLGDISYASELLTLWLEGKNAFEQLIKKYSLKTPIVELLEVYRKHNPSIELDEITFSTLNILVKQGKILGLITDGRSITQRNKIQALGLNRWISDDNIIISEEFGSSKPDIRNFQFFMSKYPLASYAYIADNIAKDFVSPKLLGWLTVCLRDNGQNIHPQNIDVGKEYLPEITINNISEIIS